jgi:hypothetical protein
MSLLLTFLGEYIWSRSRDPAVLLALSIVVIVIEVLIVVGIGLGIEIFLPPYT